MKEAVNKKQYTEKCYLDTYRVDQNKIGKASGIWQLMQESACHQMENQKPSYSDLLDEGKALMLARVDLAIPEEVFLDESLTASSWPCESTRPDCGDCRHAVESCRYAKPQNPQGQRRRFFELLDGRTQTSDKR